MNIAKMTAKRIFGFFENSQCCQWRAGQTEELNPTPGIKHFRCRQQPKLQLN